MCWPCAPITSDKWWELTQSVTYFLLIKYAQFPPQSSTSVEWTAGRQQLVCRLLCGKCRLPEQYDSISTVVNYESGRILSWRLSTISVNCFLHLTTLPRPSNLVFMRGKENFHHWVRSILNKAQSPDVQDLSHSYSSFLVGFYNVMKDLDPKETWEISYSDCCHVPRLDPFIELLAYQPTHVLVAGTQAGP